MPTPTILRSEVRRARRDHRCDHCFEWIEVGNRYECTIIAHGNNRILEMKCHMSPPCPPPFFDPYEEKDLEETESLPLAA